MPLWRGSSKGYGSVTMTRLEAPARFLLWTVAILGSLAAASTAQAAGLACQQDCSSGACLQSACAPSAAGTSCDCRSGALPWGDATFAAYCRAAGSSGVSCLPPAASPASPLANAEAMMTALSGLNPWVATLLQAMQGTNGWATGPVQGLIHDSHYDATTGTLTQGAALAFTGSVTTTNTGAVQVDLTLNGDATQLTWLKHYSDALASGAIPPQAIHGTVSGGGLHGALQITGAGGQSQAVQW